MSRARNARAEKRRAETTPYGTHLGTLNSFNTHYHSTTTEIFHG